METVTKMLSKADVILVTPEVRPFSNAVLMERLVSKRLVYTDFFYIATLSRLSRCGD